jgi:hypothetical protein
MKIKKVLMFFIIFIMVFTVGPKAILISDAYKQGIYNISEIKEFKATAKLLTEKNITSLIIIDSGGNQKFYKRFESINEVINLGAIKNGDVIAIVGSGEIAITYSR